MNKRNLKLLIIIFLLISISLNLYVYLENKKLTEEKIDLKLNISDMNEYLNSITVKNFEKKVLSGDDFFVYVGRPDCGDCNLFEPMFKDVIKKYNLNEKIIYMNIKSFRENDKEAWEKFKNQYGFTQTPAIIHFNNGNNIDIIEWDNEKGLSYIMLIEWLKNINLIK